jgi:hypothetical protein
VPTRTQLNPDPQSGKANRSLPPQTSPQDRYVIEWRGEFLRDYYIDDGSFFCDSLAQAKQFRSLYGAQDACRVLGCGQVKRVIVDERGNHVRIALLHERNDW